MRKKGGFILVVTLLVMSALFFLSVLYLNLYGPDKSLAVRAEQQLICNAAASAGIDDAIYQLKRNTNWTTGFSQVLLPQSRATYTMTFDRNAPPFSTNNFGGAQPVNGWNGRAVSPGMVHLVSLGSFLGSSRVEECLALVQIGMRPFTTGVYAKNQIKLVGTVTTDSFDSALGGYGVGGNKQNTLGDVATNSGAPGAVSLNGTVDINGAIKVGPGGSQETSVKAVGNAEYQTFVVNSRPTPFPFFTPPTLQDQGSINLAGGKTAVAQPGTYSDWKVNGGSTLRLKSGTYVVTGDITISSNSLLVLPQDATVTIYVLGNVKIDGSATVNNPGGLPPTLQIFGGPNTTSISINGTPQVYEALYAPAANITIGGTADFFGALVGNNITINGAPRIHYDRSLATEVIGTEVNVIVKSRW